MTHLTFDDVLDTLLEDRISPTHENLVIWTARFPEFSDELADFFANWAVQDAFDIVGAPENAEHLANNGVSYALNLLHAQSVGATNVAIEIKSAPARLLQLAKKVGLSAVQLATKVGVDEHVVLKLDKGRIRPLSEIPRRLFVACADALQESTAAIQAALSMAPVVASAGGLRKAKDKAVIATETFDAAIRKSSLQEHEKQAWLLDQDRGVMQDEQLE